MGEVEWSHLRSGSLRLETSLQRTGGIAVRDGDSPIPVSEGLALGIPGATGKVAVARSRGISLLAGSERSLLAAGLGLRFLVFVFMNPLSADTGHFDLVKYIAERHAMFPLTLNSLAFHPPLYYLLAAPFYLATGSAKGVQVFSLVLSVLTLLVFYRLLYKEGLIEGEQPRRYVLLLVCFLPPFIMTSLFVSNDGLAFLIGALVVLQIARFVAAPNIRQLTLLAIAIALGLLTKATFLVFLPVMFVLVLFVGFRQGHSAPRSLAVALLSLVFTCSLGSYNFIRSYREAGNPFISGLDGDYAWVAAQKQSYRGVASFLDVNVLKLLTSPSLSSATEGAYPVLLYGTFWYNHVPGSNFAGSARAPFNYLGSVIYALSFVPSAVFFAGLFLLLKSLPTRLASFDLASKLDQQLLVSLASVCFLFGNIAMIVLVLVKYHVWSVMSARLLFPLSLGLQAPFSNGPCRFWWSALPYISLAKSHIRLWFY